MIRSSTLALAALLMAAPAMAEDIGTTPTVQTGSVITSLLSELGALLASDPTAAAAKAQQAAAMGPDALTSDQAGQIVPTIETILASINQPSFQGTYGEQTAIIFQSLLTITGWPVVQAVAPAIYNTVATAARTFTDTAATEGEVTPAVAALQQDVLLFVEPQSSDAGVSDNFTISP